MNKNITIEQAKALVNKSSSILDKLKRFANNDDRYIEKITMAAEKLKEQQMIEELKSIPVEEVNKDKDGIRIKLLRDANYNSIADLYMLAESELAQIHGIGKKVAHTIKQKVREISLQVRKEVRIKLNLDDKSDAATLLVVNLSKYKNSLSYVKQCKSFLRENGRKIESLINDVKIIAGMVTFSFNSDMSKAYDSYDKLNEIMSDTLVNEIEKLFSILDKIACISSIYAWDDFSKNAAQLNGILQDFFPDLMGSDSSLYGLPEELAKEVQNQDVDLDGLTCSLRKYQELGVKYILHQEKVLLGDEMGLGKTVQAIAAMVSLRNKGATHFMVICPAGVLTNWCREIAKHSNLEYVKIHGKKKKKEYNNWLEMGGVAVTTYETISDFMLKSSYSFSLLVIDEAHYIKNPNAKRTRNVEIISKNAKRLLFMTGTALENKVDEMLWLMSLLQPEIAQIAESIAYMHTAQQFKEKIAPVYYRRKRNDVLNELPEKIEHEEWCTMTEKEEFIYEEAVLNKKFNDARRVSWSIDDFAESSKAIRLREIVKTAESEGRKVLVFSYFLETLRKVYEFLGRKCAEPITGSVPSEKRQMIIDHFEKNEDQSVLIAQINAGGTGLNIQAASVVVICEPQLKPSIENQAIARAYRMGQARTVSVHRLLCEDSIDERIMDMLASKQKIFDAFADESEAALHLISEIDSNTFLELIEDEAERIKEKRAALAIVDDEDDEEEDEPIDKSQEEDDYVYDYTPRKYDNFDGVINDSEKIAEEASEHIIEKIPQAEEVDINVKINKTEGIVESSNCESVEKEDNNELYQAAPFNPINFDDLLLCNYTQIVRYLLEKYGKAACDFYLNEDCQRENPLISRKNEGLICHHIKEFDDVMIDDCSRASEFSFESHKAENLVYCNGLEHLILHVKIAEELKCGMEDRRKANYVISAINRIIRPLNGYYDTKSPALSDEVIQKISNEYDNYIKVVSYLWKNVISNSFYSRIIDKMQLAMNKDGMVIKNILTSIS